MQKIERIILWATAIIGAVGAAVNYFIAHVPN